MEQQEVEQIVLPTPQIDLDTPTSFLGLTQRKINDWEARHRAFCKLAHRQPCTCSAWD